MQFCPKCKGLMEPQKKKGRVVLVCRKCGKTKRLDDENNLKLKNKTPEKEPMETDVVVLDKKNDIKALPKTRIQCRECENDEAYWWLQQTRSVDEAPTRFFKCTKCGHTWRQYD